MFLPFGFAIVGPSDMILPAIPGSVVGFGLVGVIASRNGRWRWAAPVVGAGVGPVNVIATLVLGDLLGTFPPGDGHGLPSGLNGIFLLWYFGFAGLAIAAVLLGPPGALIGLALVGATRRLAPD